MNDFYTLLRTAVLAVSVFCLAGGAWAAERVPVFVSVLPQKYFLEQVGGDLVDVSVMVMPGASPATYEPTPRQMAELTRAKGYFSIGVPFENTWLARIAGASASMRIIHTDDGIEKKPMTTLHQHEGGGHGDHHGESHGILDPHIWLSPRLVRAVAGNICRGLIDIDSGNRAVYESNLDVFLSKINVLDGDIRRVLASVPKGRRAFMVYHPSWGYFAREYGLEQIPIEAEGKAPSPRELAEVIELGRREGISAIFIQPQFSDRSARVIASEVRAEVVVLDPLAENWADNLRQAAGAFRKELR